MGTMGPMTHQLTLTTRPADELVIDCDTCIMRRTHACDDCVVTFLIERDEATSVVLDIAEVRAMRMLADAGLVPTLRHRGGR